MTGRSRRNADHSPTTRSTDTATPRILAAALLMLLGVTVGAALAPSPVAGQTSEPKPIVRIVAQTTFVPADGVIELLVEVDGLDGLAAPRPAADDTGTGTGAGTGTEGAVDLGPELSVTFFGRLETENQVDLPPSQPLNRLPGIPIDA
ncbi:MAG: hypothetical protein AAGA93_26740, partial [Actinomycetota bacterium]